MTIEKRLDNIIDTKSKVRIIRLFISRREDFMSSGNDIARSVGLTPPAVHASLKELYDQGILKRDIVGRQHIYRLNSSNRIVKDILRPAFQKEISIKEDIQKFLIQRIKKYRISGLIISLILYGSLARGKTHGASDCDIAVIVKDVEAKKKVENLFIESISAEFSEYFGISLDIYVKTGEEFTARLKKRLPPVTTLMKAYIVFYGKDPIYYR